MSIQAKSSLDTSQRSTREIGSTFSDVENAGDLEGLHIDNRNPTELGEKLLETRKKRKRWKLSTVHERMIKDGSW